MAQTKPRERERSRILTNAELKAVWNAQGHPVFMRFVRFLLRTTVRRGEASEGHARELKDGLSLISAERMKGKVEFLVSLPARALELIGGKGFLVLHRWRDDANLRLLEVQGEAGRG